MSRKLIKGFFLKSLVVSAMAVVICCGRGTGQKIVIKGSTTVLPITQKAIEFYQVSHPEISITVEGSGSGNGIKALLDGSCNIANSSRKMTKREAAKAQRRKMMIKEIIIAYDMIEPIVHPSNPVDNLSIIQLRAIFDGSIENWSELGFMDEKVVVVSRDTSSGTYEIWEKMVMNRADVTPRALLQASNGMIIYTVAGNPRAIGYVGYGYINSSVKPLKVNGVPGTVENGKTGKFPISRPLYMYVNEERLTGEEKKFIEFLLSEKGQELVRETGYIPL